MKYSDYKRLGKISIASRKKSTKNTVRGISFGLIIIIPIIFFTLAFYLDLTSKINDIRSIASFNVATKHFSDDSGDSIIKESNYYLNESSMLGYDRLDYFTSIEGVNDYIVGEYYNFEYLYESNDYNPDVPQTSIVLNGVKYPINHRRDQPEYDDDKSSVLSTLMKFHHLDLSTSPYITQAEADDLKKHYNIDNVFIAGGGFKGDGTEQIILSERLLKKIKIDTSDIINKKITLEFIPNFDHMFLLDDDKDPNNEFSENESQTFFYDNLLGKVITIFKEYEVVGIVSEKLYKLDSRYNEADFWFHANSLIDNIEDYPEIKYTLLDQDQNWIRDFWVVTYENDIIDTAKNTVNNGKVFMPLGFGAKFSIGGWQSYAYPVLKTLIQCEDYHQATVVEGSINAIYSTVYGDRFYNFTNNSYFFFSLIYKTGLYAIIILLSFGGIIFFATLLNLYNSINYSVQSRRNYIGVMRAIGSKEKMIPRLYFVEIMLIFMKAFVWILIFSGLISFGIKALVDSGFNYIAEDLGISLKLNFLYFPVTIIIMVLAEFTIAFIYSQVACRAVSKKPILEILKDEK